MKKPNSEREINWLVDDRPDGAAYWRKFMKTSNLAHAKQTNSTLNDSQTEDLESKFKLGLTKFAAFAANYGLTIEPYSEITWTKFRSISGPMQQDAYDKFNAYSELCVAAADCGITINDDRSLAWWAIQKFGLRPCSDFFDKLTKDNVLELYNRDFVQIYRNWAFFQISSYSMGDLFVYPWPELYVREPEVTQNLIDYASMALSGSHKHTVACTSPRHIVVESLSAGKNILDMELNYVSPLFDQRGAIAAFFAVSSVTKVGKKEADPARPTSVLSLANK